jgi:hypothetical protein
MSSRWAMTAVLLCVATLPSCMSPQSAGYQSTEGEKSADPCTHNGICHSDVEMGDAQVLVVPETAIIEFKKEGGKVEIFMVENLSFWGQMKEWFVNDHYAMGYRTNRVGKELRVETDGIGAIRDYLLVVRVPEGQRLEMRKGLTYSAPNNQVTPPSSDVVAPLPYGSYPIRPAQSATVPISSP